MMTKLHWSCVANCTEALRLKAESLKQLSNRLPHVFQKEGAAAEPEIGTAETHMLAMPVWNLDARWLCSARGLRVLGAFVMAARRPLVHAYAPSASSYQLQEQRCFLALECARSKTVRRLPVRS